MNSRREIIAFWETRFEAAGVDSPRLSAQVLLAHVLNLPRLNMLLEPRSPVAGEVIAAFDSLALRRLQGEPIAYLVGFKEFYGLEFEVNPDVLIPRPETELMVDHLLGTFARDTALRVLDLGTGSGALAVTCAAMFPSSLVTAADISEKALATARRNARKHGVAERVGFVRTDLVQGIDVGDIDIILANLPYVPEDSRDAMCREVLRHEPWLALFAGHDGLDVYRRLASGLRGRVREGLMLLCEIDQSQGAAMMELFGPMARDVSVRKDLAGLNRLVVVVF
ncbi:Release factor glutamine methyltransferase [anaerobic digester metagenome]